MMGKLPRFPAGRYTQVPSIGVGATNTGCASHGTVDEITCKQIVLSLDWNFKFLSLCIFLFGLPCSIYVFFFIRAIIVSGHF